MTDQAFIAFLSTVKTTLDAYGLDVKKTHDPHRNDVIYALVCFVPTCT
jgi:hypothetical protein